MLKIKVNLDEKCYQALLNDIVLFKIIKKDGSPNKNKFMNLLFKNYYQDYLNENNLIIDKTKKLMQEYNFTNDNFAQALVSELIDYKHSSIDTYYNESLTFYLNDDMEFIFNSLNTIIVNLGASSFFRNLIYRYLEYPQYKREEIIYRDIVKIISEAITLKKELKIKLDKQDLIIKPYKIGTSKEEIFSYLLGLVNGFAKSIHIYKIKAIFITNIHFNFNSDEENLLKLICDLGIQYPFNNICNAEIELDDKGIKLYNAKYLNRPKAIKIDGNHYYFECAFDQLVVYFMSFGGSIKVISPKYLGKVFYNSYKSYVDNYIDNN